MKRAKLRITGLEEEAMSCLEQLKDRFEIIRASPPRTRRNSREVSIYAEVGWEEVQS